jgi:signal transduction histidine kinase
VDYVLRSDPDTAGTALDTVLQTSGEALDEMRRMLALLRVDPETYEPAPSLSRLPDLVDRVRAAGVPVEMRTIGTPPALSPGLELCAYRVIQESLTNVLKHARPATAAVWLDYGPRLFTAVIRDEGVASGPPAATGHGLNGMRERATLYGGTLTAGPHEGGGFEVRLTLPLPDDRSGEPS